jgi:hypothetical protein
VLIQHASLAVSAAQPCRPGFVAYEAALRYTKERVQFGKPIASHQLIQDLLVKSIGNITPSIGWPHLSKLVITRPASLIASVGHLARRIC